MNRKYITTLFSCLILSLPLLAANQTSTSAKKYLFPSQATVQSGFRIGVGLASHSLSVSENESPTVLLNSDANISLGYAQIPSIGAGFLGRITYNNYYFLEDSDAGSLLRFDGNLALAFNAKTYGFAGVNTVTAGKAFVDVTGGVGMQVGAGIQLKQNIAFEIGYVRQTLSNDDDEKASISGLEFSLVGVF